MLIPVLLIALSASAPQLSSALENASSLFRSCQAAIRLDSPSVSPSDVSDGEYCLGYFRGFGDVVSLIDSSGICLAHARTGALIKVYVAYMNKNPKQLDDPEILGVVAAMHESYPRAAKP
jgi:hypothetical protein